VEENIDATNKALESLSIKGEAVRVRFSKDIEAVAGLILPGGESTVIGTILSMSADVWRTLQKKLLSGMPVLGTCAGMIVLSTKAYDRVAGEVNQKLLGVFDIVVERNSFGRQIDSFEVNLTIEGFGVDLFRGVFIRAPSVISAGPKVKILGQFNNKIVAVRQGNMIATSFHPELSDDIRFHKLLLQLIRESMKSN
jgi:5'-phosphate synthase pdxT subunit